MNRGLSVSSLFISPALMNSKVILQFALRGAALMLPDNFSLHSARCRLLPCRLQTYSLHDAETKMNMGIHREAPPFVDQSTEQEILVTGIKVQF